MLDGQLELDRASAVTEVDDDVWPAALAEVRELETGARRQAQLRYGLLAQVGDLWGWLAANGRASLGLDTTAAGADMVSVDLAHPDLAGIAEDDLPLALATCASAAVVVRGGADAGGDVAAH